MEEKQAKKPDKTPIIIIAAVIVFTIFLLTNGFGFFNKTPAGEIPLSIGDSPILGNTNAPLTIYLFSDFSCPFCKRASLDEPVPQIIKNYIDTGKAKLVWKYFPGHGKGEPAQLVGFCLNEQDLFWEFHELAFQNQEKTNNLNNMKALAQQLNANMPALNECLSSKKYNSALTEDTDIGKSNGISGTPTFVINERIVEGAVSFQTIKAVIDKEL